VVIATVANVAPLTGFLGTVTGMIKSFDELARAGLNNPGAVAAGISEALITTATGLIIAIPTLMCYNWFNAKIARFILEMETGSNILLETFVEMESKAKV
jgi:biopolymer transport protein ExbB